MSDPLGMLGGSRGINPAGGPPPGAGGANRPGGSSEASFKDLLMANIKQVNQAHQEATTATEDLVSGKRNDLEGVLLATQKADTAFRMLLAVRNKVVQAYEEVKQMRV
ncbi:MAG: flagellar hook-basal body complex protein FliE [Phycisphaerae bacterium]|nr:flagellar hook-basal body complex protein FliE [Phycisphaerae bacterium]